MNSRDLNDLKVELNDPWLGKRIVGDCVDLIRDQLRLLKSFRDDGRRPSKELLRDIKVYEFILNSPEPDLFAEKYLTEANRLRDLRKTIVVSKIEVAKNLGWKI